MMGRIIQLPGDHHRQIQLLLPWYLTGGLDETQRAQVEAHLDQCDECQADLRDEQRLSAQIADLPVAAGAPDVEHGWDALNRLIALEEPRRASLASRLAQRLARRPEPLRWPRPQGPWLGWAAAVQFCLLLVMGGFLWSAVQPAKYHALGAAPANPSANLVVIFRPDTPEKDLRQILRSNDARLVDGPTVSDAYLLHVPAAGRVAALARLRRQAQVVLAEPVDSGAGR